MSNNPTLPKEFKFQSSENPSKTAAFILYLVSLGYESPDEDVIHFIYLCTTEFTGCPFTIEDNIIKLSPSPSDLESWKADPVPEFDINDFDLSNVSTESIDLPLQAKILIRDTIASLAAIDTNGFTVEQFGEMAKISSNVKEFIKNA